jgi:hypothetical protein
LIDEDTKIAAAIDPYDVKKGELSPAEAALVLMRSITVKDAAEKEGVMIGTL